MPRFRERCLQVVVHPKTSRYRDTGVWRSSFSATAAATPVQTYYEGTGAEILQQLMARTGAPPEAFVAGVGTGGSITGIGRRLREVHPQTHIVSVIPDRFPGIEGLKPLGHPEDIVPAILDESLINERIPVTIEQALTLCRKLAKRGIFVGPSSGAYVHAARQVAATGRYRTIVTLLCDTGERYGSTGMWRQDR
ncbi:MAG: pyridoxal-phosphate dependent enzyme [Gammaproteobacteria bacterium]